MSCVVVVACIIWVPDLRAFGTLDAGDAQLWMLFLEWIIFWVAGTPSLSKELVDLTIYG